MGETSHRADCGIGGLSTEHSPWPLVGYSSREGEELLDIAGIITREGIPGGTVIVTDFKLPGGRWVWRLRGRLLIYLMLLFFRVFAGISARRLPDIYSLVTNYGWKCRKEALFDHGLVCSWILELPGHKRS